MAYNRRLLYTKSFPSWNTPEGNLGNVVNDVAMTPIQLVATEIDEPGSTITYAVTTGSLPTGLTLSSSGEISGTPTGYTAPETVNFTITATDDEGETAFRDFNLKAVVEYDIQYLVVAGGGAGGGTYVGGGGGAGGYLTGSFSAVNDELISAIVGSGGVGPNGQNYGSNGQDSVLSSNSNIATAIGGGRGGYFGGGLTSSSGGSGAGATYEGTKGLGTPGQGFDGGESTPSPAGGGGGGGAGGVGVTAPGDSSTSGPDGGPGLQSNITGSLIYYAGGGGAGGDKWGGQGGIGGGGNGGGGNTGGQGGGAVTGASSGTSGLTNSGSGGGGAGGNSENLSGGSGGSGVVILRMPTISYSGITTGSPTVTTNGSDTILKYTGSGTYTG